MVSPARLLPLIVASALFMENMDATVIATSLPAMAADLGTDPIVLKLAFTTYLLSLTVFIPISGWCADRFGAKHVFRAAIAIFMAGSIACGYSQSLGWLVSARALQGLGGAMMVPVGRLIILREVPRSQLVEALAWLTIPALIGPLAGPPIGGFITTYFDWRWIFWMNIPIGILGLIVATRFLPEMPPEPVVPLDVRGFLLSAIGLSALVFGFTIVGRNLLPGYGQFLLIFFGAASLALYVRHAATAKNPILDLKLLRIPTFRTGVEGGSLYRVGVGAIPFLMPLMFQLGFGLTAFQSGLLSCWAAVGALAMKFSTSALLHRFGFRPLLIVNGMVSCLLISAYGLLSAHTPYVLISLLLLVGGFLRSLQFTALNALSYSDISRANTSNASTFYAVAQQFSLSAGVAVAAFVLEAVQALRGQAIIASDDFSVAFIVVAGFAMLSVFQFLRLDANAGSSVLSRRKPVPAESVAEGPVEL